MLTGTAAPVIRCRGVVKRFGRVTALDGLDLDVAPGRVVGFLGPNGSGKSTLIRILLDLARPDEGDVEVLGSDPRRAGPSSRRLISYLPGELRLDERLAVDETLESWARLRGTPVDRAYATELCERLVLDPSRETKGLSSGNRRKVGLVGAFMARPRLLVLDEPTSGVDPLVQAVFAELVREATADGATVFLSSHVLSEVQHLADDVVVIRSGRAVSQGTVQSLLHVARQPFRVTFEGEPPVEAVRRADGVAHVQREGEDLVGVIEGRPDGLLRVLADHRVVQLLMPEPELEDAFLRLFEPERPRP